MRSLFWKIFLWFWLAMTLVIAATAVVSFTVQNASDNRTPPEMRAVPRWRLVADASFAQWAQAQAQSWESGSLRATPAPDASSADADSPDDLESWLLDENPSFVQAPFGDASQEDLEWWLFARDGKLLFHHTTATPSTSKKLHRDVQEITRRAMQTDRVVTLRPEVLGFPPPERNAPILPDDTPPRDTPPRDILPRPTKPLASSKNTPNNSTPNNKTSGDKASGDNEVEALLATSTRTPRGKSVIFVARLPFPDGARPVPPDATARRVFPLAGWFLRGEPLTRTLRFLTMLLTAGLFCWWLAHHVTRPITQLRVTVDELSSGNLAARSDPRVVRRADELGDLGRDFNAMAARLETLIGAQKRLVADVSHELRSPLARLNVALEIARRQLASNSRSSTRNAADSNKENENTAFSQREFVADKHETTDVIVQNVSATRDNAAHKTIAESVATNESSDAKFPLNEKSRFDSTVLLDRIEREATRLETIVAQLLTLSRPDDDAQRLLRERIEIAPLLREIAADVRFEYSNIAIEIEAEHLSVFGSRELLRSAIENIVRNAARFSPPEEAVHIYAKRVAVDSSSKDVPRLLIEVRDGGTGVPDQDLPRLFEPFYRVEEARDRQSGGAGLGLAIAQRAIHLHGGSVRAENFARGGLLVTIDLPIRPLA